MRLYLFIREKGNAHPKSPSPPPCSPPFATTEETVPVLGKDGDDVDLLWGGLDFQPDLSGRGRGNCAIVRFEYPGAIFPDDFFYFFNLPLPGEQRAFPDIGLVGEPQEESDGIKI